MSDFPRGWTLSAHLNGAGTPSITVPVTAGVVHVLDSFTAKLANGSTTIAYLGQVTLSSSDGVFATFVLGTLAAGIASAGGEVTDDASASGLDLAAGPGASLTITFSSALNAGQDLTLLIQGHDI